MKFNLSRYFSMTSLAGVICVVAVLSLFYRFTAIELLIGHETRANTALTKVFANIILNKYSDFIANSARYSQEELMRRYEITQIQRDVINHMAGLNVVKVKIYNLEGVTIFSTELRQIGEDKKSNPGFLAARDGQAISNLTYRNDIYDFEKIVSERDLLSTYIPMTIGEDSKEVVAVFELYSDVTLLVDNINKTLMRIVAGVFFVLSLLYLFLHLIVKYADGLIRQHEAERTSSEEKIRYLAYHDPLTRLPNKTKFLAKIRHLVQQPADGKNMVALLFVDLDHFKLINDSLGHDAGDELLKIMSRRLKTPLRKLDSVYRWGGDEFTIILNSVSSYHLITKLCKRLLNTLHEPIKLRNQEVIVTASIGISVYPNDNQCFEQLIKNADAAMFHAKRTGRNRYAFYNSQMNARALERLSFETGLKRALRNSEFDIYYQPKISAFNGKVVGVEALLRWNHPEFGLVSPDRFIHYLEQSGLIKPVGEWVLSNACLQAKKWQDQGLDELRMSINISAIQFLNDNIVDQVKSVLNESDVHTECIELELTESAFLQNANFALRVMNRLKEFGVKLSIDDFGSGYSSLQYLRQFPLDFLKIDRSFVQGLAYDNKDAAITGAISNLAYSLGMRLIAEGVENTDQMEILKACGCHEFQGFLFSPPVPPEKIPEIVHNQQESLVQVAVVN